MTDREYRAIEAMYVATLARQAFMCFLLVVIVVLTAMGTDL